MVTEFFIMLAANFTEWFVGLFPDWEIPPWMFDNREMMVSLMEGYVGLGVWVDWQVLGAVLVFTAATYAIGILIRIIRAAVAHIPQFGGGGA